jgi:hypothetical protein
MVKSKYKKIVRKENGRREIGKQKKRGRKAEEEREESGRR